MTIHFIRSLAVFGVLIMGMSFIQTQQPWTVPDKDAKTPNPIKSDAASISAGKALWGQHCASCHGKTGMGDGSKAAQLKTPLSDFSTPVVQGQSDGSLFYKIAEGKGDMPSYKKKIPDADEIWDLVNYIRKLKK
jgi:mono/diheme cytochrome c family protein